MYPVQRAERQQGSLLSRSCHRLVVSHYGAVCQGGPGLRSKDHGMCKLHVLTELMVANNTTLGPAADLLVSTYPKGRKL